MVSDETRDKIATVMMVVGFLSTIIIVGMAWGVPLLMWGWDIKRRLKNKRAAEGGDGDVTAAV